ncbi:MAG: T9SS type A sorting domain-containing protein, partial [Saprospiraceae bacterium]
TLKFTIVKPSCFGGSNGSAKVTATGTGSPFTYLWSNGATTQTATGLAAGTYTVTVTTAAGCTKTGTATVTQPTDISIAFTNVAPACAGDANGTSKATASGGTGTKTYLWSTGATTQTITGLAAGTYTVTATDTKGCTKIASTTLTDPAPLQITGFTSALSGGSYRVTVTAVGGTGTKNYRRSTGPGTFTAWQTSRIFTGVPAGTYTFEVQDAKLCTTSAVQAVPVVLVKPGSSNDFAVGKNTAAQALDFQLAPNPARASVQILFSENMPDDGLLEITDATGRTLVSLSVETLAANGGRLDLARIPAGVAFVTLRAEGRAPVTRRLIVE